MYTKLYFNTTTCVQVLVAVCITCLTWNIFNRIQYYVYIYYKHIYTSNAQEIFVCPKFDLMEQHSRSNTFLTFWYLFDWTICCDRQNMFQPWNWGRHFIKIFSSGDELVICAQKTIAGKKICKMRCTPIRFSNHAISLWWSLRRQLSHPQIFHEGIQ